MMARPGLIILFGSGETMASGRPIYGRLFGQFSLPIRIAVLETPAGFEPNSAQVAEAVARFFREHLQNFRPIVTVVPARKRGTPFSPDDRDIVSPLLNADMIFLGPGSPTYAARQLRNSLAWEYVVTRHRHGAAVVFASAGATAAGSCVLPVYEIYKVGADLHWQRGLDFLGPYDLPLAFVPHWNNREGGEKVDTSRCYMGKDRFETLASMLPAAVTVVGIDEHTALTIDVASETCQVLGQGVVTLQRQGGERCYSAGQSIRLVELGPFRPLPASEGPIYDSFRAAKAVVEAVPPEEVMALAQLREKARGRSDWFSADALRAQILAMGWQIADGQGGPVLTPARGEGPTQKDAQMSKGA